MITLSSIKQFFTKYLTNSWMTNDFFIGFMAHLLGSVSLLLTVALLSKLEMGAILIASAAMLFAAAIKEFVYDLNFEIPKQTLKDSALDFVGYCAGIATAWLVIAVRFLIK